MHHISQFKPVLYCLLLLGICGFAMGAESPILFFLGSAGLLINGWLVWAGWFRPMPRLISNVVTIAALIYVIHEVLTSGSETVMLIGEFLLFLQMVKLWEQRGNRDYAQLLVLSLLLMVAAAINTGSVFFGIVMVVYLILSLYCCVLFHLKVESDAAGAAMSTPQRKISPTILRQDQRRFAQSMRKLTVVMSSVGMLFAAAIFILFPRGTGAGVIGGQFKATRSLVGFSDQVSFQKFSEIQQNEAVVAFVKLSHNGQYVSGGTLLLRGVTLDAYKEVDGHEKWCWVRSPNNKTISGTIGNVDVLARTLTIKNDYATVKPVVVKLGDAPTIKVNGAPSTIEKLAALAADARVQVKLTRDGGPAFAVFATTLPIPGPPNGDKQHHIDFQIAPGEERHLTKNQPADTWEQEVTLEPTGTNVLFAMAGPCRLKAFRPLNVRFSPGNGELRNELDRETRVPEIKYIVTSSNSLGNTPPPEIDPPTGRIKADVEDIRKYIHENKAAGSNAKGLLDDQRLKHVGPEPDDLDEEIAQNIENYLKDGNKFQYTLNLSGQKMDGRDPLIAFLRDFHEGHCQYFAGAMTLMCQSLGMKARMCLGFRCNEFGAGVYIVRQSHAHAWVEVFTKDGWKTFDPTSDADSRMQANREGLWQKIRHVFNFMQFTYGNTIIGFSNEDRTNLLQHTQAAMLRAGGAESPDAPTGFRLDDLWPSTARGTPSSGASLSLAALLAAIALGLIVGYVIKKRRLRRLAARIGLSTLPRDDQQRLARQLAFYDDLMTLLARHRIQRQNHQTPLEFSQSLLFLPAGAYEVIGRLTGVFYRVRYGRAELTPARQRRLGKVVERLEGELPD